MRQIILALTVGVAALCFAASRPSLAAGDTVRIGVMNDQSSGFADAAGLGSVEAARMAAEDAGNRVGNRRIEIVSADHQSKPDVAAAIARRWYDVDGVDAIADVTNSAAALAVQTITRDKNRVLLISGSGASLLTGKACTPNSVVWTFDTYALASGIARAVVGEGGKSWFFVAPDYAFGQSLRDDASSVIEAAGGSVLGGVRHPVGVGDYSSFLLQAQASGAQVIAFASVASDLITAMKQAQEFGLSRSGQQRVAGLFVMLSDVNSLGLDAAQGLYLATGFYWDRTEASRAWSKRYFERMRRMPTEVQAGVYSAVRHYLEAVKTADTTDAGPVMARMRATPVRDMFADDGHIAENGLMVHDWYLARVKAPAQQRYPWDYYEIISTIPGRDTVRPSSGCPLGAS